MCINRTDYVDLIMVGVTLIAIVFVLFLFYGCDAGNRVWEFDEVREHYYFELVDAPPPEVCECPDPVPIPEPVPPEVVDPIEPIEPETPVETIEPEDPTEIVEPDSEVKDMEGTTEFIPPTTDTEFETPAVESSEQQQSVPEEEEETTSETSDDTCTTCGGTIIEDADDTVTPQPPRQPQYVPSRYNALVTNFKKDDHLFVSRKIDMQIARRGTDDDDYSLDHVFLYAATYTPTGLKPGEVYVSVKKLHTFDAHVDDTLYYKCHEKYDDDRPPVPYWLPIHSGPPSVDVSRTVLLRTGAGVKNPKSKASLAWVQLYIGNQSEITKNANVLLK